MMSDTPADHDRLYRVISALVDAAMGQAPKKWSDGTAATILAGILRYTCRMAVTYGFSQDRMIALLREAYARVTIEYGRVFVMNDNGKTVACYVLSDAEYPRGKMPANIVSATTQWPATPSTGS